MLGERLRPAIQEGKGNQGRSAIRVRLRNWALYSRLSGHGNLRNWNLLKS